MIYYPSNLKELPPTPGIYKMKNKTDTIIYIGKAKNLKNRIKSYFQNKKHDYKTQIMIRYINHIEIIETQNEKEAFILENQLIKSIKPKYNILLKDDKTFPYIKITTNDPFPRIIITRNKQNDKATYYGPYPSMGSSRALKKTLYSLFPIRDCKLDITLEKNQPKCMLLDIGKCIGPCIYKHVKKDYDNLIEQLHLLLKGKNKKLISLLKQQMKVYSENLKFEKAAITRDRLIQLEHLIEAQRVAINSDENFQIWSLIKKESIYYILVQEMIEGKLLSQHGFYDDSGSTKSPNNFIEQTYLSYISNYSIKNDTLLCTKELYQPIRSICLDAGLKTTIETPQRGLKKELLTSCIEQTSISASRISQTLLKQNQIQNPLIHLQKQLKLTQYPKKIIGCDISHLQSTNIVASAVCFINGTSAKHLYRKFNIKSVTSKSNDPLSMKEVVYRRLLLCIKNSEDLPNLLLIDGGIAQLNFAYQALQKLNLESKIDIISLAKKHEEIYKLGLSTPLRFPKNTPFLHLCQQIRDESHRFAVSFQRQKRHKIGQRSLLETINGIGKQKLKALYSHFDSLDQIKFASIETLTTIKGINIKLAKEIKKKLSL
jgi:excinuclease ABC subunit C